MNVLMLCEHSSKGYSGGRYFAWTMAEALATFCQKVTVLTRERPFFENDFAAFPAHGKVEIRQHGDLALPHEPHDLVICVPSLSLDWTIYARAIEAKAAWRTHLMFIDFESPQWYNENNAVKRTAAQTLSWRLMAGVCDSILSFTRYGSDKAAAYYKVGSAGRRFVSCIPSINSIAADQAQGEPKAQVICIARITKTSPHKGLNAIRSFLREELRGYDLVLLGRVDEAYLNQLREEAAPFAITVVNAFNLDDIAKFRLIKSSRLMLFPSDFEGLGLPPLEAAYCGVPCIVKPLPVYPETLGEGAHRWNDGDDTGAILQRALQSGADPDFMTALRRAGSAVSFEAYADRLKGLIEQIGAGGGRKTSEGAGLLLRRNAAWLALRASGLAMTSAKRLRKRARGSGLPA